MDPAQSPIVADYLAAGAIIFAAVTNIIGVQFGALLAGLSTIAKFGALTFLVLAAFVLGGDAGGSWGISPRTERRSTPGCSDCP